LADPIVKINGLSTGTDFSINKKPNTDFFANNSIGIESYIDKGGYNGSSLRYNTTIAGGKWGSLKAMPMINFDKAGEGSPDLRLTLSSPSIHLGEIGGTTFSGSIENRTTFKFDNQCHKTDLVQEPRGIFEAKNGDWTTSITPRAKFSEQNPTLNFNGGIIKLQKKCGKINPYLETYLPKEVFTKGNFNTTNFAVGVAINL